MIINANQFGLMLIVGSYTLIGRLLEGRPHHAPVPGTPEPGLRCTHITSQNFSPEKGC